jgi:hypothetical protein
MKYPPKVTKNAYLMIGEDGEGYVQRSIQRRMSTVDTLIISFKTTA